MPSALPDPTSTERTVVGLSSRRSCPTPLVVNWNSPRRSTFTDSWCVPLLLVTSLSRAGLKKGLRLQQPPPSRPFLLRGRSPVARREIERPDPVAPVLRRGGSAGEPREIAPPCPAETGRPGR